MKRLTLLLVTGSILLASCAAPQQAAYEYKVMSLYDMFGKTKPDKLAQMMISVPGEFNRTDLDVPDYQEALDRLSAQGWELVAVNRSNYWVFRRAKAR